MEQVGMHLGAQRTMAMMEQVACWSCVFFLALLLLRKLRKRGRGGYGGVANLPPSPWRLPVIGNLHQVLTRGGPLVHHAMADLARRLDAPLMYLQLGEVPLVVASSPDAAREITTTHDTSFGTRPWNPSVRILMCGEAQGLVFARCGALWRQMRKICILELLSARRVRSFRRIREEEAHRLVATIAAAAAAVPPGEAGIDVGEQISLATTNSVVRPMLGDRFDQRKEFLECLAGFMRIAPQFSLSHLFPSSRILRLVCGTSTRRAEATRRKMSELMDYAIRMHQESRAADGGSECEDMVDVLLRLHKEDCLKVPLTMGTIKTVIRDLLSAGSETSANTVQWAIAELVRNRRVMERAQSELRHNLQGLRAVTEDDLINLTYLKLVIKETLRLYPTALIRKCTDTCKVMGYDIPKGTTVLVNTWAIGRDPRYWVDPEAFKPERFETGGIDYKGKDFEFIPFGAGRRMCPGMTFAEPGMELVLASLLYHFDWELPAGVSSSEMDMAQEMDVIIRRKNGLYLRPVVRVPLQAAL